MCVDYLTTITIGGDISVSMSHLKWNTSGGTSISPYITSLATLFSGGEFAFSDTSHGTLRNEVRTHILMN